MNSVLLSTAMSFGERMSYGLQVFVVGLGTVFAVLIILWLALLLFKVFAYDIPQKQAKKATEERLAKAAEEAASAPVVPEFAEEPVEIYDDSELIAVITAAIEAYNTANGSSLPFRVVSFKRVSGANGWNSRK